MQIQRFYGGQLETLFAGKLLGTRTSCFENGATNRSKYRAVHLFFTRVAEAQGEVLEELYEMTCGTPLHLDEPRLLDSRTETIDVGVR